MKEAAPQPAKKKHKKHTIQNVPKTQKVTRLPAKMQYVFFLQGHKTLRLPRKMDVLKFIGGRRSKCIFLNLNVEKTGFRPHEEQHSNGTNDNFGDGETRALRVYIYIIYIYTP